MVRVKPWTRPAEKTGKQLLTKCKLCGKRLREYEFVVDGVYHWFITPHKAPCDWPCKGGGQTLGRIHKSRDCEECALVASISP